MTDIALEVESYDQDGARQVTLRGDLTIYTAPQLKSALLAELDAGGTLSLDLSSIIEFDSAGLQVLLACAREAVTRKKNLFISAMSKEVQDRLDLLNVSRLFKSPLARPSRRPQAQSASGAGRVAS